MHQIYSILTYYIYIYINIYIYIYVYNYIYIYIIYIFIYICGLRGLSGTVVRLYIYMYVYIHIAIRNSPFFRHLSGKMAGQTSDWANGLHVFDQFLHPLLLVRGTKKIRETSLLRASRRLWLLQGAMFPSMLLRARPSFDKVNDDVKSEKKRWAKQDQKTGNRNVTRTASIHIYSHLFLHSSFFSYYLGFLHAFFCYSISLVTL